MARRLTTNQEIAGSIPASVKTINSIQQRMLILLFCHFRPFWLRDVSEFFRARQYAGPIPASTGDGQPKLSDLSTRRRGP
jgi:hypothetical protein